MSLVVFHTLIDPQDLRPAMAVHFKFRSAAKFDSVDLEESQSSISIRDLKSRMLRLKHLNLFQDSDLLFSDAVTGEEYSNENVQIPRGASVIIKRVPARSAHFITPRINCKDTTIPQNIEAIDFDDFGVDVYPIPEPEKEACYSGFRCLEPEVGECLRLEASGTSDAKPGHGGVEQPVPQKESKPEVQEVFNPEKLIHDPVDTKNDDLPSEMKCSLCKLLFKEAVMIPCCQHSFCAKCIGQVLLEKARCPKCFSTKCRIADLLPNISLRQAIEHLKESQNLITGPDNGFGQYAPDAESGIQEKDVSYGGSGKKNRRKSLSLHKNNQIDGERYSLAVLDDFQGESKPIPDKAEPATKKSGPPWVVTAGGGEGFMDSGKIRKGDRACYLCGSPDHLIRECPIATSPCPMLNAGNATYSGAVPAYVPPYWNGVSLPHALPFRSPYGNHVMMAFNNMSIPPTPFSYYPHMHMTPSAIPGFGGYMGMGGVAPFSRVAENCGISSSEFPEGQQKRRKYTKENFGRDQSFDDDGDEDWERKQYNRTTRLQEHRSFDSKGNRVSYCSDDSAEKSQNQDRYCNEINDDNIHSFDDHRKGSHLVVGYKEGKWSNRSENSSSEIDDMPRSFSRHSEEKHKDPHRSSRKKIKTREQCDSDKHKYHHKSSRYQKERNERYGNDSSWSDHQNISEKDDKRKRQKHHSYSGSGSGHSGKKLHKGSSRDARKSEHNAMSSLDDASHNRWKMVSGSEDSEWSDEDHREEYLYCKQKRVKCC